MVCRGIVKDGRVELQPGVSLPEGAEVQVNVVDEGAASATRSEWDAWLEQCKNLARRVSAASPGTKSAVDTLIESRR